MPDSYDVIIVGGRPAGASLAARLGRLGHKVLVLDRTDLATRPPVPSCPTLHMGTLALLDELGIDEAAYGKDATRFDRIVLQFGTWFETVIPFPTVDGRDYGYSIDRASFDAVLWANLAQFPSVTRRRFGVTGLLRGADGAVVGVEGHEPGGAPERITAPWVVGADGRFSFVAAQAGGKIVEEETTSVSTVFFTEWEGVAPHREGDPPLMKIYSTVRGLNVLFFPLPGGLTTVCLHVRADRVETDGDATAYYEKTLRSFPEVAARMRDARRAGTVLGMKRVGNGYRTPGGPGWLLLGDAWHYKDPVDGQGIYDALLGSRILAEELERAFGDPTIAREAVVAAYGKRVYAATHPMYAATIKRLQTELYSEPPVPVIRTLMRWMLQDPVYQERFMRFLCRDLDPSTWVTPGVVAGVVMRGVRSDIARLFRPRALPGPRAAV